MRAPIADELFFGRRKTLERRGREAEISGFGFAFVRIL
jgi:hypothetical protein